MKIVSACLVGINCKYDGKDNICSRVVELVEKGEAIPVCPEQLCGLATPRDSTEINDDQVITKNQKNVTEQFEKCAEEAFKIAKMSGCAETILKKGNDIFAQKLKDTGINIKNKKTI